MKFAGKNIPEMPHNVRSET